MPWSRDELLHDLIGRIDDVLTGRRRMDYDPADHGDRLKLVLLRRAVVDLLRPRGRHWGPEALWFRAWEDEHRETGRDHGDIVRAYVAKLDLPEEERKKKAKSLLQSFRRWRRGENKSPI